MLLPKLLCGIALSASSSVSLAFSDANWTALSSGLNGQVNALAVSGSNVYAGGRFTLAGNHSVGYIARWDGSSWTGLGSGMNGYVYALAASGTNLYAGGAFTTAGGITVNRIAKWNGSSWSGLGTGITGYSVAALLASGTNLYAGGDFSMAGYSSSYNISRWNGTSWSALGAGTGGTSPSPEALALAIFGGELYAGGDFITAGNVSANHIARWDGLYWWALGSGMGDGNAISVYALAVSGSTLYAGGRFHQGRQ